MYVRNTGLLVASAALVALGGCATLQDVIQAPRFSAAADRQSEVRLLGPSADRPMGGLALRIWTRVENPNLVGFTLSHVAGNLFLDGNRLGIVDFPLGVPLLAGADTVIPMEVAISFADLPGLVDVASRVLTRNTVGYRLDGTVTVDAGVLGQPSFGPSTLVSGNMQVFR